jgi:LPPG:FO 2-phospho-L-lactate transferase
MKVACLSGGVGGAKLVAGLYDVLGADELTVIANVGDDLEVLGMRVSPDLDSILYAVAGLNDTERGWGRSGETWRVLEAAKAWGGEGWFLLGDLDLGLHLVRTQALARGEALSQVAAGLVAAAGLDLTLLPATDDELRTHVLTPAGRFPFQDWFVGRRHRDEVNAIELIGVESARAAPGTVRAIVDADLIVFAPSNPYVSLEPILALSPIRESVAGRGVPCVAVSPLVGGAAVKGPLDRMLQRMAGGVTPAHLLSRYAGLVDVLIVDSADASVDTGEVELVAADILMPDRDAARRLARLVLEQA